MNRDGRTFMLGVLVMGAAVLTVPHLIGIGSTVARFFGCTY